jgi:hypothetical protein
MPAVAQPRNGPKVALRLRQRGQRALWHSGARPRRSGSRTDLCAESRCDPRRPGRRYIANDWREITRLDRPVPLSTAPRGSLARHRGFPPRLEPSTASTPRRATPAGFLLCTPPTLIASHEMLRRANSPMRYLFRWTRIIQRHPVNVAR